MNKPLTPSPHLTSPLQCQAIREGSHRNGREHATPNDCVGADYNQPVRHQLTIFAKMGAEYLRKLMLVVRQARARYISPLPRKIKITRLNGKNTPPLYRDSSIVPSWRGGWGVRLVSLVMVIILTACSALPDDGDTNENNNAQPNTVMTATPIPTAPVAARPTYIVQRGIVQEELTFSGRWQPRDQTELAFEIGGTVSQVNVKRGDAVTAGTLLAQFDTSELESQLANAQISLETALANQVDQGDSGVETVQNAEVNLANNNLSLQDSKNTLPWTSVASARLQLDAAERDLYDAQRNYNNTIGDPNASASQVDSAYQQLKNAEDAVKSAEYSYFSAAQSYNSAQNGILRQENSVLQSEAELERARAELGANSDADVRTAQLNIDEINHSLAQSALFAPMDGVVLEVNIERGDSATAYETVIIIGKPEPLEVISELAFGDTQDLSVGMIGRCEVSNQPETAVGCIVRQIPLSNRDADQTTRVAASLENVAMGQLIEVTMALDVRENVLWLPPSVIRTFQNRTFVVLETPEGPRTVDITIGLQTDERVEITSGVNEGDVVIAP